MNNFQLWLKNRLAEDNQNPQATNNMAAQVTNPQNALDTQRRQAIAKITSNLMKKNPQLKPGSMKVNDISNLSNMDSDLKKSDSSIQQGVGQFFLKNSNQPSM